MSVGDVVIVHSADQPRGFWRLGHVKEVPCAPPCESKPSEPELELEQSAGVTVTPGDGQNRSQEIPQEDCSHVEPQCPLRRSRRGQGGSVSCTV